MTSPARGSSERAVFTRLADAADVHTIEAGLLYHVVPGVTIDSKEALKADRVNVQTALDGGACRFEVWATNLTH